MNSTPFFSSTYVDARAAFIQACQDNAIPVETLPIDAPGPDNLALGIDIAWIGDPKPKRVLMHSSGLHGVEGFVGSAIQLHTLRNLPVLEPGVALVLAHVLNPWGMAWLRRTNENNVDLNRNFPCRTQRWSGTNEGYRVLNDLLNPASPPSDDDFMGQAETYVGRMGIDAFSQAVAGGQYETPHGLFFGGRGIEPGPERFVAWTQRRLARLECVFSIDVHSGIGPRGRESVFTEADVNVGERLLTVLKARAMTTVPYSTTGAFTTALPHVLPDSHVVPLTQEFGTEHPVAVLHALREENRWQFHGEGTLEHPSKQRLMDVFVPNDTSWRAAILEQGSSLLQQVLALLNSC